MKVSVSILKELNNYKNSIEKVNNSNADYLHLDIMDNTFTNTESFNFNDLKDIDYEKKIDVHLMSTNLDELIDNYSLLKPEIISFHYEVGNTLKYIEKIKEKNIKVGLAINPETSINKVEGYLDKIDYLLIMSVVPGKGGQAFIDSVIPKIKKAYELKEKYNYLISVDGSINENTIVKIKDYVDVVVSGSYITDSIDYNENISKLKE